MYADRSIFRKQDPLLPQITTDWATPTKEYVIKNSHLEEYPLFKTFDKDYFMSHQLPMGTISFRINTDDSLEGQEFALVLENLFHEIDQKKHTYKDFDVVRKSNFNRRKSSGALILKSKKYPFIVKLFKEDPHSFVKPNTKGFEPIFFFLMGGGVNRHLTGFTRIKNLEIIREKLAHHPEWKDTVDVPRKWFYLPKNSPWIKITGKNIGKEPTLTATFPGTYCIVADAINYDRIFSIKKKNDRKIALDLCNAVDLWIDPHIDNFFIEKETQKIVIIDTEHFPTVVGLKENVSFDSYTSWYSYLVKKCAKDKFFKNKKERRAIQHTTESPMQLT